MARAPLSTMEECIIKYNFLLLKTEIAKRFLSEWN
jgi:hypothetical protein